MSSSSRQRAAHKASAARQDGSSRTASKRDAPDLASDRYVLVVDDVEDNRFLYASYLEHAGFRVVQACDGEQALEQIAREAPAVVLMDLGMPNLDGWEATRLIKTNPATAEIAVIVLTGFATYEELRRAKEAGADDIRTKPCLPHDLLPLVRRHLERRS